MNPVVKTAFFHEVGHLIAREINLKHFGVMGATKEIRLYPSKFSGRYDGETIPEVPEGEDPQKSTVSVAEKLAVIPYGCYIEAIYLERDFEICFSPDNSGGRDLVDGWSGLKEKAADTKALYQYIKDHFNNLKESGCFKELLKIDVEQYLIETEKENYIIDLEKLRKIIAEFLLRHEEIYLPFVESIRGFLPRANDKNK